MPPALPKGPVFSWASLQPAKPVALPALDQLPHCKLVSSGRAAIYQALRHMQLPAHSTVLVPSYHCPTMVAPVVLAGHIPEFFAVGADALPLLSSIDAACAARCRAMLVPHYFGFPQSLACVRQWCDEHAILLIEDCAHSYFGSAGERPVGAWGDYATGSITKFFPVPEAGLLASASRPLHDVALHAPSLAQQGQALIDVLERAAGYRRLFGMNRLFSVYRRLKQTIGRRRAAPAAGAEAEADGDDETLACLLSGSDMGRIRLAPSAVARWLGSGLPRSRIALRRQHNFARYALHFSQLEGARALLPAVDPLAAAPYAFPLWVARPEALYRALHDQALPVFRWDRLWPGVPAHEGDLGPAWSRQVLQFACHQDLGEHEIDRVARVVRSLLGAGPAATAQP